jgi:TolA-binding protein
MKINLILIFLFLVSCKTQEDIKREEVVDSMAAQMSQHQKISAQYASKALELEEKLTKMVGALEEKEYQNFQTTSQELTVSKKNIEDLRKDLDMLKLQILEQKEYLEKILSSLSKMGEVPSKKKSKKGDYEEAIRLYNKGFAKEAKPLLAELVDDKKLDQSQKAKVTYFLGMIAYQEKKYSDAVTLFSRLYTQFPSSSHSPSALLYLGRSFLKLKKDEEGKQVLQELVDKYPNSSNSQKAIEILKNP